ncbi:MAG: two-component regulator propeller domain-containing protein [Cyclobacteriaceae bacterium]
MKVISTLFLLFISLANCFAQSSPAKLMLYSITEQNGLSDNRVTCFFQDSRGFMWIGTQDGLNLFDGSIVKRFKNKKNDTTSIASNYIRAIAEDSTHQLWFATLNGLCKFDPIKKTFSTYQASSPYGNPNMMWDLKLEGENIWLACGVGLIRFSMRTKKFDGFLNQVHEGRSRIIDNRVTQVLIDRKKRFWVSTHNGLWRFYPEEKKYINVSNYAEPTEIITMIEDHSGKIWMGLWGKGIQVFDPDKNTIKQIKGDISTIVAGLAESKNEKGNYLIWSSGLVAIDQNENLKKYTALNVEHEGIFGQSVFYFSADGLLWVATPLGVRILDPNRQSFSHYFPTPNEITNQSIALFEKKNLIYVGGHGKEFLKLYDSAFSLKKDF